jgi:hypothetical protein
MSAKSTKPVEGAKEHVVAHVLGLGRTDRAGSESTHHVTVALDKRLESREVASHRAIDQLPVGVHRAVITDAGKLLTHPSLG